MANQSINILSLFSVGDNSYVWQGICRQFYLFFFAGLPTGKKYREELRRKRKREQEKAELQQTEHKTKRQGNSMG